MLVSAPYIKPSSWCMRIFIENIRRISNFSKATQNTDSGLHLAARNHLRWFVEPQSAHGVSGFGLHRTINSEQDITDCLPQASSTFLLSRVLLNFITILLHTHTHTHRYLFIWTYVVQIV